MLRNIRWAGLLMTTLLLLGLHPIQAQDVATEKEADLTAVMGIKNSKLNAEPGQYVLVPSKQFVTRALEEGLDKSSVIYYTATVVNAGETVSEVESLAGSKYQLPNCWMIPIPKGGTAEKGDLVLTWWQTGSGMQRAIVVGGSATEPEVLFLDMDFDNPAGIAQKTNVLKPDSFIKLTEAGQLGTTAVGLEDRKYRFGRIVAKDDQKTALLCFAGRVQVFENKDIQALPLIPDVQPGDAVQISAYGSMREGKVVELKPEIGRVVVEYPFGGDSRTETLSYGEVTKELK